MYAWHRVLTTLENMDISGNLLILENSGETQGIFTARSSYASAVLGIVILSVRPSVRPSYACFVTKLKNIQLKF